MSDFVVCRRYRVSWQLRRAQMWHAAEFADRQAALDCFFGWMARGVAVRWACDEPEREKVRFAPRRAVIQ